MLKSNNPINEQIMEDFSMKMPPSLLKLIHKAAYKNAQEHWEVIKFLIKDDIKNLKASRKR